VKKFKSLMDNAIRQTQLVRVRLKVDPALCANGEIMKYQGYEGFVLAEHDGETRVYVESCNDVIMVPSGMLEPVASTSPLDTLKIAAVETLQMSPGDALVPMIIAANSPEALEAYLREHGVDAELMLCVYRKAYFASI
jgi:hypothetical protein